MLLDGEYQPLYASDTWALGQLGLALTGGKQPKEHQRLQNTKKYIQELEDGIHDLTRSPGHKDCAHYLMQLTTDDNAVNYGDQVSCLTSTMSHMLIVPCAFCCVDGKIIHDGHSMFCLRSCSDWKQSNKMASSRHHLQACCMQLPKMATTTQLKYPGLIAGTICAIRQGT